MKRSPPSPIRRRHFRSRRGTSLIECLFYISALSTIGVLGFQILNRLLRLQGTEYRAEFVELQQVRLERQWRDDVHRAEQIALLKPDGGPSVTLTLGPQVITYEAGTEGAILRTLREVEMVRGTERWDLDAEPRFRASSDQRLLTLELRPLPLPERIAAPGRPNPIAPLEAAPRVILDASVGTGPRPSPPSAGGTP